MTETPVLDGLIRYAGEKNISFHMPGHKNNINDFEQLKQIQEYLYKIDCTEVPGLDNLHMPEGIIEEGQILAAKAYGAKKSYFLVNGSTSGIYSMIMGVTKPGDKIIVQRNCHRSVFTACLLGELDTVYVNPTILKDFNIPVSLNMEDVKSVIDSNPDAKAIVLTYPTYYGTCCDIESIIGYAHDRGMLVLVDEAHGAHLAFNERLPKDALKCGADAAVVSLHKSTPAMTQCALLNVNSGVVLKGIEFMLRAFQTTSPSYIFMASIDASRWIMESRGRELIDDLLNNIDDFSNKFNEIEGMMFLSKKHIGIESIYDFDPTKLVILSEIGGIMLSEKLRHEYKIQVEMSDINNILLISSIGDNKKSFDTLKESLMDISKNYRYIVCNSKKNISNKAPEYKKVMNMREAYYRKKCSVKLKDAEGMVSGEMAAPYPPGVPVILPGEMITSEIIEYLSGVRAAGIPINGLSDQNCNEILVVE